MKSFARFVWVVAALWAAVPSMFGQGAIDGGAVMVQVRGSYTTIPSLGIPSVTVSYTPDGEGAEELSFSSTAQNSTSGATAEKSILLPIAKVFRVYAVATNVTKYQVSFAVPRGYQVTIEEVAREAVLFDGNQVGGGPVPGTVDRTFEAMITRITRPYVAAASSGSGYLGDATPISWSAPWSAYGPPSIPWIEFNLGNGLNGEPLPPLHLMMSNLNRSSEFILWTAPWCFEEYEGSVADVTLEYLTNGDMRLRAPQVTVEYILKAQSGSQPNDVADFELRFYEPGDVSNLTPFAVYTVALGWERAVPSNSSSAIYYKSATVTKTVSGVSYSTALTSNSGISSNRWTLDRIFGGWLLEDWHRGGTNPRKISATRNETIFNQGTANQYSTYYDDLSVYEATPAAPAIRRRIDYNLVQIPYPEIAANYKAKIQAASIVTNGTGANQYATQVLLDLRNRPVGGVEPSGFISVAQYTGSGATLRPKTYFRPYKSSTPVFNPATLDINPNGGETTEYIYTNDWTDAPILPVSIRRRQGKTTTASGTLASESTTEYSYETTPIPGGSGTYPILKATRYDFDYPSSTGGSSNPTQPRAPSDGTSLKTIVKTYRQDASNHLLRNRPHSIERPDNTKLSFLYETGTYVAGGNPDTFANPTGTDFRITAFHGSQSAPIMGNVDLTAVLSNGTSVSVDSVRLVPLKSTKTIEVLRRGLVIRREVYVCATTVPTWELISWESFGYAANGELTSRTASNNTSYTMQWSADRTQQTISDETTTTTTINYDAGGRSATVTTQSYGTQMPARVTNYEYDADGRVTRMKQGPAGSEIITQRQYNDAGYLTTEIAPGGVTTKFEYPNNARDFRVIYNFGTPMQSVQEVTRHTDGRTQDVTGSAVVEEHYTYDFDSGRPRVTRKLANLKRPSTVVYDLLGRVLQENSSRFAAGTGSYDTLHYYDTKGRRSKTLTTQWDGAVSLPITGTQVMEYDDFSQLWKTGLDLDGVTNVDDPSEPATAFQKNGIDRFQRFDSSYYKDANSVWWRRTIATLYHTNNSPGNYSAISQTRLGTLPASMVAQSMSSDFYGRETWETSTFSTSAKNRLYSVLYADKTTSTRTVAQGLVTDERTFNSADQGQTGMPALATSFYYDAQGRMTKALDLRTAGNPLIEYYAGTGRPWKIYDARGVLVATHTYDDGGRLSTTTTPATAVAPSATVTRSYTMRGELMQLSGSGIQPSQRDYSEFGELIRLRTYRSGLGGGADQTTWTYDDNTGWLSEKTDAQGRKVTYNYQFLSSGYRDITRTWARSTTSVPATARSRYLLSTGDLQSVDYSDPDTTDLAYTYTRTGQPKTVTDAAGARTFSYDREQLATETLPAFFGNMVMTTAYQSSTNVSTNLLIGRYAGFKLGIAGDDDKEMATIYGYDNLGRIGTITADYKAQTPRAALNVPAVYRYKTASSMWDQLTQGNYTVDRFFEGNRDVLTLINNGHTAGGPIAFVSYKTDDQGRIEWRNQLGMAFSDYVDVAADITYQRYVYDASGQLTGSLGYRGPDPNAAGSSLPGRAFSYSYDDAGNRKTVAVSGDTANYRSGTATTDTIGANSLNQPRSRDTMLTRLSGTSNKDASVSTGSQTASRESPPGRYWDLALLGYGQNATATVTATLAGQPTQSSSVPVVTRAANDVMSYDEDGNLTGDAQWTYQWDGENRLRRMERSAAGASWGAPNRVLVFTYDFLGRRIRKVVTENGAPVSDRKFLYHGWNLVAEIDSASGKIVRSYAWGLDMASSLTATGGVGALVLETIHTDTTLTSYHVAYDGQGNVTALVNRQPGAAADGKVAASYEYGPFGEKVRATLDPSLSGALKDALSAQPFRFSTKFTDIETGLVYYGLRYYDPSLGRFLNRDPIAEAGGNNLYGFVGNSPVNRVDVLGLADSPNEGTERNVLTPVIYIDGIAQNPPRLWSEDLELIVAPPDDTNARKAAAESVAEKRVRDNNAPGRAARRPITLGDWVMATDGMPVHLGGAPTVEETLANAEYLRRAWENRAAVFGPTGAIVIYATGVGDLAEAIAGFNVGEERFLSTGERLFMGTVGTVQVVAIVAPVMKGAQTAGLRIVGSGDEAIRLASPQAGALFPRPVVTAGMEINPAQLPVFRGGSSIGAAAKDMKIVDGMVQPTRGVSVFDSAARVERFGGAYRIKSVPADLKVIQRGNDLTHFEIAPRVPMSEARYQELLRQVQTERVPGR